MLAKSVNSDEFKFQKSVEVNNYFGLKKLHNEERSDFARVKSDQCIVIEFNTQKYFDIVSKTQLSTCEKKVEFIIRYVPKFRSLPGRLIEDFEVYFQKEVIT